MSVDTLNPRPLKECNDEQKQAQVDIPPEVQQNIEALGGSELALRIYLGNRAISSGIRPPSS